MTICGARELSAAQKRERADTLKRLPTRSKATDHSSSSSESEIVMSVEPRLNDESVSAASSK